MDMSWSNDPTATVPSTSIMNYAKRLFLEPLKLFEKNDSITHSDQDKSVHNTRTITKDMCNTAT